MSIGILNTCFLPWLEDLDVSKPDLNKTGMDVQSSFRWEYRKNRNRFYLIQYLLWGIFFKFNISTVSFWRLPLGPFLFWESPANVIKAGWETNYEYLISLLVLVFSLFDPMQTATLLLTVLPYQLPNNVERRSWVVHEPYDCVMQRLQFHFQ